MHRHLVNVLVFCTLIAFAAVSHGETARKAAQPKLPPLTILSIIPAQGEPGMMVTLNGTGFTDATAAFLGSRELPAAVTGARILTFEIPDLPSGIYALYLKREDGSTSRPFNFMVQPLRPVVSGLAPDNVAACAAGREREVIVTGGNFLPGARVLFDGAAIGTRYISTGAVSFVTPQLPGGLHQIQVKNPADAVSGTVALFIDSKPEILSAAIGTDNVSYYDLVISGRNFQQSSTLVADGIRIPAGNTIAGEREQMVYMGCNQIIYQRHPYDPTPKEIRLQVINPTGEESSIYSISAP